MIVWEIDNVEIKNTKVPKIEDSRRAKIAN